MSHSSLVENPTSADWTDCVCVLSHAVETRNGPVIVTHSSVIHKPHAKKKISSQDLQFSEAVLAALNAFAELKQLSGD